MVCKYCSYEYTWNVEGEYGGKNYTDGNSKGEWYSSKGIWRKSVEGICVRFNKPDEQFNKRNGFFFCDEERAKKCAVYEKEEDRRKKHDSKKNNKKRK